MLDVEAEDVRVQLHAPVKVHDGVAGRARVLIAGGWKTTEGEAGELSGPGLRRPSRNLRGNVRRRDVALDPHEHAKNEGRDDERAVQLAHLLVDELAGEDAVVVQDGVEGEADCVALQAVRLVHRGVTHRRQRAGEALAGHGLHDGGLPEEVRQQDLPRRRVGHLDELLVGVHDAMLPGTRRIGTARGRRRLVSVPWQGMAARGGKRTWAMNSNSARYDPLRWRQVYQRASTKPGVMTMSTMAMMVSAVSSRMGRRPTRAPPVSRQRPHKETRKRDQRQRCQGTRPPGASVAARVLLTYP